MADFSTKIKEWDGGYGSISPNTATKSDPWGELAAKIVPGMIEGIGKGYAAAQGSNILGGDVTATEAEKAVQDYTAATPFQASKEDTPDRKAEIEDMRMAALKKFGTDDKRIQALVTSGKISTIEANARRAQLLQEKLSNPILAMFKDDFIDAAKSFTGGSGGASEDYNGAYIPTVEERAEKAAIDKIIDQRAKHKAAVEQTRLAMGVSEEVAEAMITEQAALAAKVDAAENKHKLRQFNSADSFTAAMDVVDSFSAQVGGDVAASLASGHKIQDVSSAVAKIEAARQQFRQKLDVYRATMTPEDYLRVEGELSKRVNDLQEIIKDGDAMEYQRKRLQLASASADITLAQSQVQMLKIMGPLYTLHKYAPEYAKVVQGVMDGTDKGAELAFRSNTHLQSVVKALGINVGKDLLPSVVEKVNTGKTKEASTSEAWTWISSLWSSGGQGVKAEVEMNKAKPDAHTDLLKKAFSSPEASISQYANSRDWVVQAKTADGAKAVAEAFRARVSSAKARQALTGDIPNIDLKVIPDYGKVMRGNMTKDVAYKFNVPPGTLDKSVQDDLVQMYKVLNQSPLVLKELGYATADEAISNYFNMNKK